MYKRTLDMALRKGYPIQYFRELTLDFINEVPEEDRSEVAYIRGKLSTIQRLDNALAPVSLTGCNNNEKEDN